MIAGFPSAFIGMLFTGALLVEIIFSLDGLGLLGFEAAIRRDYPVMFGTLYIFTLLGLMMQLVGDLTYTLVDPRIDFEARAVTDAAPSELARLRPSPGAAWRISSANRRGFWSLWIFSAAVRALAVRRIHRQRPAALVRYDGHFYFPVLVDYPERRRSAALAADRGRLPRPRACEADRGRGWMVWPPIPYGYDTVCTTCRGPAPVAALARRTGSAPTTRRATCWRG